MTERRLSEIARHLNQPSGIVSSDFTHVERIALKAGIRYDPWQRGLLWLLFARRADGRYACGEGGTVVSSCRQIGKTFTLGTAMFVKCLLQSGLKVIWTAHHTRTSDETFADLCDLAKNPVFASRVDRIRRANGQQEISFRNGSRIMFGARENGFGRGLHSVDVEIFDEAQILTVRALDNMLPVVNTSPDPLVVFLGNPPKPGDQSEVFEEKRRAALDKTDGMVYVELSADPDADLDDHDQWAKANPSYPQRTSETAILRMRNLMGDDSFRREALGIWDETTASHAIDPQQWADAIVEQHKPGGWTAIGVDMPPDRSSLAIGASRMWTDGTAHIELTMFRDTNQHGTQWAVDWITQRWPRMSAVVIDAQSPATVLVPELKRQGVHPTLTGPTDMGQAVGRLRDMLRDHKLTHLTQAPLDLAAQGCTLRNIGQSGAQAWNKLGSDTDISPLVAVTLALHGTATSRRRPGTTQRMIRLP